MQQKPVLPWLVWATLLAANVLLAPSAASGDSPKERHPVATARSETMSAFSLTEAEAAHDLGYVEVGAVRSCQLVVRNNSANMLRISAIRSECSCMTAKAAAEEIPPEGATTLTVEFHAPPRASRYAKRLVLLLEGGRPMKFPILFTARVGLPLTVEPRILDLGTLIAGETRRRDVVIHNDGRTPVKPVYATSGSAGCHAAVPRAEAPAGGILAIPIILETSLQSSGPGKTSVAIHMDCPEQSQVDATVGWEVSTAYCLSQSEAKLGSASPGERRTCRFEIAAADAQARDFVRSCELTELENLSGKATVSYAENRATITCDLVAGAEAGPLGGKLLVTLADHGQPVEILIDGLVRTGEPGDPGKTAVSTDAVEIPGEK
ncbi:MAG: DUF1573 domain-containing protein [Phycisphaerae bacterium]|nr:DUF1573 domain-containing protein [Phycisphaerae bacterium]